MSHLLELFRRRSRAITYLYRDTFDVTEAAPMASPRASGLVVTDTGNRASVVAGKYTVGNNGSTAQVLLKSAAAIDPVIGRALYVKMQKTGVGNRWGNFGVVSSGAEIQSATNLLVDGSTLQIATSTFTDEREWLWMFRNPGYWLVDKTNSKLMWVSNKTPANRIIQIGSTSAVTDTTYTLNETYLADSGGVWATQYGTAASYVAAPADGEVSIMPADAIVEFTWSCATGQTLDFQFRRVDDNNCWIVRCIQSTNRIYLYEKNAGTETERGATGGVARTWTNGNIYRITVIADGQALRVLSELTSGTTGNASHITYATASFNLTATGMKVSGFVTGATFAAWARNIATLPTAISQRSGPNLWAGGDSRISQSTWQVTLNAYLNTVAAGGALSVNAGTAGIGLEAYAAAIATNIALWGYADKPKKVIINLGMNNMSGVGGAVFVEATNKASFQTIITAIRAAWPDCQIYIVKPWGRGYDASSATMAGWIDTIIAANPGCYAGFSEAVLIKAGDDGTANTTDGVHYSAAGMALVDNYWRGVFGY
jgi:lysophospholipase L1-like esterase